MANGKRKGTNEKYYFWWRLLNTIPKSEFDDVLSDEEKRRVEEIRKQRGEQKCLEEFSGDS